MLKIILGIIVGFIVWSVLWVGSSAVLTLFGADYAESMKTMKFDNMMLISSLFRSFVCSIIAGFVAVLISKEFSKTTLGLGILLLLFGIGVQSSVWNLIPIWYHLIFLALLIPFTLLGGRLGR